MTSLIADSGSTKTDWCVADSGRVIQSVQTQGLNPYQQDEADIRRVLADELLPQLVGLETDGLHLFYYGAGCTAEKIPVVAACLRAAFPTAKVEVASDLLGAARALCQHDEGVACILGTGSNSCLYDGEVITANVSPLGYILGDEGSGAVLGRHLVGDLLKGQLPSQLKAEFLEQYHLTPAIIVERVYRQPLPNRFLASLSLFLAAHRSVPEVHQLLVSSFIDFFRRNVALYAAPELPVHFVGGIAHQYEDELHEAAQICGFRMGKVEKVPMPGMVQFHAV